MRPRMQEGTEERGSERERNTERNRGNKHTKTKRENKTLLYYTNWQQKRAIKLANTLKITNLFFLSPSFQIKNTENYIQYPIKQARNQARTLLFCRGSIKG